MTATEEMIEIINRADQEAIEIMLAVLPLALKNDDFLKEASQCTTRQGVLECMKKYA